MTNGSFASAAGITLATATRAVAALRPAAKPLHPRGMTSSAVLVRHGKLAQARSSGVPWLDEAGRDAALVRTSKAVGLPGTWPDVLGLAVRIACRGRVTDLLLATTGWRPFTRFLLRPARNPDGAFYGSLLPYRSAAGPLSLGAVAMDKDSWVLLWAHGRDSWVPFGTIRRDSAITDEDISFDPVLNGVPGLPQYDAVARLRCPSYRAARRSRDWD